MSDTFLCGHCQSHQETLLIELQKAGEYDNVEEIHEKFKLCGDCEKLVKTKLDVNNEYVENLSQEVIYSKPFKSSIFSHAHEKSGCNVFLVNTPELDS